MSMTKSEFVKRYLVVAGRRSAPGDVLGAVEVAALAEEAGVVWAPEPPPEPTGDLSMVRVIDAKGFTWRPGPPRVWIRVDDDLIDGLWPNLPRPVTVLRPEGGSPCLT